MTTGIALFLAAALIAIDQILKAVVVGNMDLGQRIPVIDGLLNWHYIENSGAALGMLSGFRWVFIGLTAVVVAGCLYYLVSKRCQSRFLAFGLSFIIAGGIGNLIDRIFRAGGVVIDYVSFSFFPPVFNFADACVTVGVVMVLIYLFFLEGKQKKAAEAKTMEAGNGDAEQHTSD